MVNLDTPNDYIFPPSEGAPQLTINHEVAADLDSSNAFEGPEKLLEVWFAPTPDCLPPGAQPNGLKAVPGDAWVAMLDLVNCKILSVLESEDVDAYLLSESSMFVFPHKLILKTCGTTTLLLGLHRLLRIAAEHAGFPFHNTQSLDDINTAASPYRVFYSRKNFLFPDKQRGPHRSWKQEVEFLDDMFEGGSAYMVGKMNGDHWYLYITSPETLVTRPRATDENGTAKIPTTTVPIMEADLQRKDETLEILMTDLDPDNAKQFYLEHASAVASSRIYSQAQAAGKLAVDNLGSMSDSSITFRSNSTADSILDSGSEDALDVSDNGSDTDLHSAYTPLTEQAEEECLAHEGHALGTVVSDACGLSDVYPTSQYPDARIDAYLFSPCGFSANGIVPAPQSQDDSDPAKSGHYFTVHVTPEPNCSFASFETNVPSGQDGRDTPEIVEHVVSIFKPGRFSVTLFEAKAGDGYDGDEIPASLGNNKRMEKIPGYRRIDRIIHDFDDYQLVFRFFEREDWAGGNGIRVGEDM
ncbi:S-adenosylmethionine decarboxylase [Xylaria sp. CBS 124048]|nr:S-adenosylmethionine decarboxylase [Xylaria sp. CBS 124048]